MSMSIVVFVLLASLPFISSVSWFIRYESLNSKCPSSNPAYAEVDGYKLETCFSFGGTSSNAMYTSMYFCDMGKFLNLFLIEFYIIVGPIAYR